MEAGEVLHAIFSVGFEECKERSLRGGLCEDAAVCC